MPLDDKSKKNYDPSASLIVKNALKLRKSDETFGITPFPQEIASNINIDTVSTENNNNHGLDPLLPIRLSTRLVLPIGATSNQKGKMYKYIASRLKTRYAVTPIHTRQEFVLFSNIMPRNTDIPIDWKQKAQQWNSNHANGNDIFYKTPEILKSHHKSWFSGQVIDRTITRNSTELITMREQLQSPSRSNNISLPPPPNIPTDATITLSNTNSFVLPPPILSNGVSNSSLSIIPAQRPHSTSTRQQQHEPFVPQCIQPYIPQDIRYYPPPTFRPLQPPPSFTPPIPPSVPPTPLILPQHSHISLSPNVLTHRSSSTAVPISTWELPRKRTRTCRCGIINCKGRAQSKLCQNRNPS